MASSSLETGIFSYCDEMLKSTKTTNFKTLLSRCLIAATKAEEPDVVFKSLTAGVKFS